MTLLPVISRKMFLFVHIVLRSSISANLLKTKGLLHLENLRMTLGSWYIHWPTAKCIALPAQSHTSLQNGIQFKMHLNNAFYVRMQSIYLGDPYKTLFFMKKVQTLSESLEIDWIQYYVQNLSNKTSLWRLCTVLQGFLIDLQWPWDLLQLLTFSDLNTQTCE